MIVDTSVLLAFLDRNDPLHEVIDTLISCRNDTLIVSPLVLAELDYLILARGGVTAEVRGMREIAGGG